MKTVFHKSLQVLGAAAAGLSLFFTAAILIFMNSVYYETNTENLKQSAQLLISVLGGNLFDPNVQSSLSTESPYRISIIGADGKVAFDSDFDSESMNNHIDRPEVASALKGGEGRSIRKSDTAGIDNIYIALPLFKSGNGAPSIEGVLRISKPVPNFLRRILKAALPYIYIPCIIIALAITAAYLFSRSLGKSFNRLVNLTKVLSKSMHVNTGSIPSYIMSDTQEFRAVEVALKDMASELAKRIQEVLDEDSLLHGVLNSMNEAVFAVNSDLMLRLVNPRAAELFSIPSNRDIKTLSLLEASHSTDLEEAAHKAVNAACSQEKELSIPSVFARKVFRVFAGPLKGAGDLSSGGAIIVLEDISHIKHLEQVRKDFVANVSHELRTPIQLIKGYAETLQDISIENTETLRHCIGIIQKNALSMENLTTDLLSLASLEEAGSTFHEASLCFIKPLLDEAVDSISFLARERGTLLCVDCPEDLQAKVYVSFIVQAVINLVDNAVKYTPARSKVCIKAFSKDEGKEIVIEVNDNGPGIPKEHLERIFERFYRIDKARSRNAGGSGLGLSIVRHIALMHGGSVQVESLSGEGSTFRICFPCGLK